MSYKRNYEMIDWSAPLTTERKPVIAPARSDLPCPQIISDAMEPVEHVDGRFYTSKASFRRVTKARGLIEVGNDPARLKPRQRKTVDDDGVKAAVEKAEARFKRGERASNVTL